MKNKLLLIGALLLAQWSVGQVIVKNGSFENWEMNGPYLVPSDWWSDTSDIKANVVGRVNTSSKGSYGIKIGTDPSIDFGELYVEIFDSITEPIGALTFDYIVQNNNSVATNGAYVIIYFYDENENYLFDFDWKSPSMTNNATFKTGKIELGFKNPPVYYNLDISYQNAYGAKNEYAIFDNIGFTKYVNTGVENPQAQSEVRTYPNPARTHFMLNTENVPDEVFLVGMDGKCIQIASDHYGRFDISNLSAGIYVVRWFDTTTQQNIQSKLAIQQ